MVVPEGTIDSRIAELIKTLRQVGPMAAAEIKALIPRVAAATYDEAIELCTHTIARVRVSDEAQAGLRAFLEKKPAPWQSGDAGDG